MNNVMRKLLFQEKFEDIKGVIRSFVINHDNIHRVTVKV